MRHAALAAAVLSLLGSPVLAHAKASSTATHAEVSRLAKLSHQQYQAGDYAGAAQTLLQAYELEPVPALLFNVAKTFEKAGNTEQAMRYYQRYIDAENSDPKLLRQASRALEALRVQQEEKLRKERDAAAEKSQRDAAAEKAAADKAAADKAAADKAAADKTAVASTSDPASRGAPPAGQVEQRTGPSRAAPYTLIGVGVVGLAAGAALGVTANQLASQEKASTDPVQKPDLRSQAQRRALDADVAYGVGGAAVLGGVVLILLEPKHPDLARVLPQPLLLGHGAGLAWGGAL